MAPIRIHATRGRFSLPVRLMLALGLSPQVTLLIIADLVALIGTAVAVFLLRSAFGMVDASFYHWVLPLLMLGPLLGACLGLYQNISQPPHKEFKALFFMDSLLYGMILAVLFLSKSGDMYSRLVIMGSWAATVLTLPLMRGLCRMLFGYRQWWGSALIIFDASSEALRLARYLRRHPEHGLKPRRNVALPDDLEEMRSVIADCAANFPDAAALLMGGGLCMSYDRVAEVNRFFSKVLLVASFADNNRRFWLTPCDLGCVVGLELRQNLHDRRRLFVKRFIDILACILLLPVLLPVFLLLGVLIRLDSPGPVFFRQERLGQGGRKIRIFKFRTMKSNAAELLSDYLDRNPHLRAEWERNQKLRDDPRITRMGRILRKTSLDELPQLINVLAGEMSLVGPRPIVNAEVARYGQVYDEYCRVRPGITGLWQISGRNDTSYAERVGLDHYYINNWSVWLDLWILFRTVPVAMKGSGAY